MTTRIGKKVVGSNEWEKEVDESEPTTPEKEVVEEVEKEAPYEAPSPYKPPMIFSQRLVKAKVEARYGKFVELLKKIHLNVPFTEALTQIPYNAKFLKEILSNKRKLEDHETVAIIVDSSVVIQNMVIPKLKDLRSFSIPCQIWAMNFERELCDLGANVSLSPLSACKKLNMGEMKLTNMSLKLSYRSVKYHVGVLEDVLVRVGKYHVPVDFVIMDIHEDS